MQLGMLVFSTGLAAGWGGMMVAFPATGFGMSPFLPWILMCLGSLMCAVFLFRLVHPTPFVVIDERGVTMRALFRSSETIAFEDIGEIVIFSWNTGQHARETYIGVVPRESSGTGDPIQEVARKSQDNMLWFGFPVAMAIPQTHLGNRFDEVASTIAEIVGCPLRRA